MDNQYIINPLSLHAILNFSVFSRYISFRFVLFDFVSFFSRYNSFRYISFRFVTFRFVSFRSVSFRFVRFRFVSFRFYFVSHFTGTQKTSTCTPLLFLKILNKIIARISWQNIKKISIGIFFLHANLFMKKPLNNPYSTNK